MSFFSTSGEPGQNLLKTRELRSVRILVCKGWTRYVRLLEYSNPDTTYWQVDVSDIGIIQHAEEYQRSTKAEAEALYTKMCQFPVNNGVDSESKNGMPVELIP